MVGKDVKTGRPEKLTVDYFPHVVKEVKVVKILEHRFGAEGYAGYYKLLELIGDTELHRPKFKNDQDKYYTLYRTGLDEDKFTDMIELLIGIGKVDRELWETKKVIWIEDFVNSLKPVYFNRKKPLPTKDGLISTSNNSLSTSRNSQERKVKEREVKESEVKETNSLVQNSNELLNEFDEFWNLYNKKINRDNCEKIWDGLNQPEKEEIFNTLPAYIYTTPDVQYRKNPLTYLKNRGWEDALIERKSKARRNMESIMSTELSENDEVVRTCGCGGHFLIQKELSDSNCNNCGKKFEKL